ncbi:MAG: NAD(P)-dependent alcohol dehydrogenase [Pseudomonadota bacterium]|nr:NAD(P)-dependent alcohol dehydrogenase [Pseudomonadota bacterium]
MKALVQRCYGPPAVLKVEDIVKPAPAADEILVKVHAAAVNPLDWHYMRGEPYVMRLATGLGAPKDSGMGVDFSGTVEAVGGDVSRFKVGDAVFGGHGGALAEYIAVRESGAVVLKPDNLTFEQAAAMPIAAVTALQGLRDHGRLEPGQKVLINGASGGVGTFAVQIAKALGAEVTGVCSTRNVDLVRSLGADHVIDYTQEKFIDDAQRYDVILDNVGNHPLLDMRRVLEPEGALVIVGGPSEDPWLGPVVRIIKAAALSPFLDQKVGSFIAELTQSDLDALGTLARDGKLTAVIDRRYSLGQAAAAIEYLEQGRARGKVIVQIHAQ